MGVIERFLNPNYAPNFARENDTNLMEQLGIDSLTMLEIVMLL